LTPAREEARLVTQVASAAQPTEQAMPEAATRPPAARLTLATGIALALAVGAAACTPTVRIEVSDKPITINLNVKIDQEVRYRLDKDLEDTIAANPNLF
jgi:ferric-dicitrate binding protein FerR (iron transport regulator)